MLTAAIAIEAAVGYPAKMFRAIGHPVVWIGALIGALDRRTNRATLSAGARRARGVAAVLVLLAASIAPSAAVEACSLVAAAIVTSSLLASRSLHDHVAAVADALEADGVAGGRRAVAQIVGRDPDRLDAAGSRARRSKAWRKTFPTAWSHLPSGAPPAGCPASPPTRRSTPPTA